jgi:hypothetical protein
VEPGIYNRAPHGAASADEVDRQEASDLEHTCGRPGGIEHAFLRAFDNHPGRPPGRTYRRLLARRPQKRQLRSAISVELVLGRIECSGRRDVSRDHEPGLRALVYVRPRSWPTRCTSTRQNSEFPASAPMYKNTARTTVPPDCSREPQRNQRRAELVITAHRPAVLRASPLGRRASPVRAEGSL